MTSEDTRSGGDRLQAIAAMYRRHDAQLHAVVCKHASASAAIIEDACAHAWTQLLHAEHVDLSPPRWRG